MRIYAHQLTSTNNGRTLVTDASAFALSPGRFPTEVVYGQRTYGAPRRLQNRHGDLEGYLYTAADTAYTLTILND
jgi:hypothetical protein